MPTVGTAVGCVIPGGRPPGPLPSPEAAHAPNLPGFPEQFVRAVQGQAEALAPRGADTAGCSQAGRKHVALHSWAVLRESPGYGGTAPKGNVQALGSTGAHPACVSKETRVTHDRHLLQESQSAWEEEPRPAQGKVGRDLGGGSNSKALR